jgi:hypothetical protein
MFVFHGRGGTEVVRPIMTGESFLIELINKSTVTCGGHHTRPIRLLRA